MASPKPKHIIEAGAIRALSNDGHIVICLRRRRNPRLPHRGQNHLKGAAAVIDKDFASELLAELLDADTLIILTAVEKVAINSARKTSSGSRT